MRRALARLVSVGLAMAAAAPALQGSEIMAAAGRGTVVCFGDSLTAGFGLEPEEAYPALLNARVAEAGLPFEVTNAGLSGETTAAGARRVNWILRRPVAVFLLALGGNDGLRGIPPEETGRNLQATIDAVRAKYPQARVILAGMQAPPNMGPDFTTAFREVFPRVAKANDIPLIPFLLEGVGGVPQMNQGDGIHPNPAGQEIVAANVWKVLEPVLRELAAEQ